MFLSSPGTIAGTTNLQNFAANPHRQRKIRSVCFSTVLRIMPLPCESHLRTSDYPHYRYISTTIRPPELKLHFAPLPIEITNAENIASLPSTMQLGERLLLCSQCRFILSRTSQATSQIGNVIGITGMLNRHQPNDDDTSMAECRT